VTSSGGNFQDVVLKCVQLSCRRNGLCSRGQVVVGEKPGGGRHVVDWELWVREDEGRRGLLSAKVQNVRGTADEKVPYEVIKLLHTMGLDERFRVGWVVLGGLGWTPGLVGYYQSKLPLWIPSMVGRVWVLRTDELFSLNLRIP
jgi:hypothetical protein